VGPHILIPYILGGEKDWRNHYEYVLTHFKSPNYEKYNNKPLFSIISFSKEILEMCKCWDKWAVEDGFDGIQFVFQNTPSWYQPDKAFLYNYEPHYVGWFNPSASMKLRNYPRMAFNKLLSMAGFSVSRGVTYLDYDSVWKRLLKYVAANDEVHTIQGAFVGYDDSPRRGRNGSKVIKKASPEKFRQYFGEFYQRMSDNGKPYIFLTAWNEWGEGAYLEPDTKNGLKYLEMIKRVINS
jgi:hypothetical protein